MGMAEPVVVAASYAESCPITYGATLVVFASYFFDVS